MVAVTEFVTLPVLTVNVALLAPAGTVTDDGTDAEELFDDRLTAIPPGGAIPLSVTVPVAGFPLATLDGVTVRPERPAGVSVSVAVLDVAPNVPVMVTFVFAETPDVAMLNVALVAPAATVTEDGGWAL